MEPNVVKAVKKLTVILVCNVSTGNPSNLQKVSEIFFFFLTSIQLCLQLMNSSNNVVDSISLRSAFLFYSFR